MASQFEKMYNPATTFQITNRPSSISNKESIHSGQFMVSHFEEAEETTYDEQTDVKMPDPDDPEMSGFREPKQNQCRDVQLYVPKKSLNYNNGASSSSTVEIETSLSKLFKCMNLAYSQKLTSPKWNHFKGVRLRWKDKIRLNNVIWRCWHMQFILKQRTPVCQFASPLDVDIHSNPQSVVLEGKYWKRHLDVIKAEYRKWRRNFKSNAIGYFPCETLSDIDLMELSSISDDRYFLTEDFYTNDTLFSSINEPFPFPDRREIARSANNADLLQPNLGALQPNLDDIDLPYQELFQNVSRALPPVPEEGAEDLLKSVVNDYQDFPSLLDNVEDEINDSINALNSSTQMLSNQILDSKMDSELFQLQEMQANLNSTNQFSDQVQLCSNIGSTNQSQEELLMKTFPLLNAQVTNQFGNFPSNKNIIKGRVSKAVAGRQFRRREPHNYDKAQPTLHQTSIYQHILAEHEQLQQQQQQQIQQQQQQQQQTTPQRQILQFNSNQPMQQQFQNITGNNSPSNLNNYFFSSDINVPLLNTNNNSTAFSKSYSVPQTISTGANVTNQTSVKMPINQSELIRMLNFNQNTAISINALQQNQPQQQQQQNLQFESCQPAQVTTISMQLSQNEPTKINTNSYLISDQLNNSNNIQIINSPKETFRSNSLPLNSSIQKLETKDESFVVPKYHATTSSSRGRSRNRSNSMQQTQTLAYLQALESSKVLQNANSEPMLNSTLAQLLKNNNSSTSTSSTNSSSLQPTKTSSPISTTSIKTSSLPPTGLMGFQKQKLDIASLKSNSLPQNLILQTNPPLLQSSLNLQSTPSNSALSLSPESFLSDQDFSPVSPPSSYRQSSNSSISGVNTTGIASNQRRAGHIHAEQKRRYNIKNGFDLLHSLIPQLQHNSTSKLSKAAMLQKGAEHIKHLRTEREVLREKIIKLRHDRDILNNSLSQLHSVLPANGAPITRQRTERVKQLYNEYIRFRTIQNWKFWILGLILEPILSSYTTTVSTSSLEELHRTALHWVDQHCSLIELRPAVSNKLRQLSTTTELLSDPPSTIQEEVIKAIQSGSNCSTDEHSNDEQINFY